MFQETLLESSAQPRRRKHWPMASAFLLEITVAAALVIVPLLFTKVVPVLARIGDYRPIAVPLERKQPKPSSSGSGGGSSSPALVVSISTCSRPDCIQIDKHVEARDSDEPPILNPVGSDRPGPDLIGSTEGTKPRGPGNGPYRISDPSEAQLLKRVEPVYPHIARITGVSGFVKLHAIIAKDGSIQSLSVISGHPLLAPAAVEAVQQWKYRPYRLNGEAVEVETFITVNFKREK